MKKVKIFFENEQTFSRNYDIFVERGKYTMNIYSIYKFRSKKRGKGMEWVLGGLQYISKTEKKDELDELFEWGARFAKENGITKEKSKELLRLARKAIHDSGGC